MKEIVFSILLGMTPSFVDVNEGETNAEREARLGITAQAIVDVTQDARKIAAILSQGRGETNYAAYVGEGRCLDGPTGMRCDPGRDGAPRAATYWQVHAVSCPLAWQYHPSTVEAQREAIRCTLRIMDSGRTRCANGWIGAFSAAGGGMDCNRPYAANRVVAMNRFESMLRQ